jgi:plastocyanin
MLTRYRWRTRGFLAGLALTAAATAFQVYSSASGASPLQDSTVAIQASDFSFAAPTVVEGGFVTIDFTNNGPEPHHAQLVKLPDDLSFEKFGKAINGDERAALGLVKQVGGAAVVNTGGSTEVTVNLDPGAYALICVIRSPQDRTPHFLKGMISPLVVTPASTMGTPPTVSGEVTLKDFSIEMPDVISTGPTTLHVTNAGPGNPHELALVKLKPGTTADDARNAIMNPAGPPPFTAVGGFQSEAVGLDGYVTLNLEPGEYAAICRITEPTSGLTHVHLGMVKGFRVE